jgi:hypothetical protein
VKPQTKLEKLLAACRAETKIDADRFPAQNRGMAKKAAAQNGKADLPVSQDARQRVCEWHASPSR